MAAVVTEPPLATRRYNQEITTGWLLVVQTAMGVAKLPSLVQEVMDPLEVTAMGVSMVLWLVQEASVMVHMVI
jgi:hypothetical protein